MDLVAGLNPNIMWTEYDFDKVFAEGREEMGDKEAEQVAKQAEGIPPKAWTNIQILAELA